MSTKDTNLVENFFRHEYGRLVAMLSRRVGVEHIEVVEDAVQSALMTALQSWTHGGLPDNPSAWVFQVALNEIRGQFRLQANRNILLSRYIQEIDLNNNEPTIYLSSEVADDLLRMLFICCDKSIPVDSQLVFALKMLCGFSTEEIAHRLFTSEANIYQRLSRAKSKLRLLEIPLGELGPSHYAQRLPSVHKILYLLFTEGYFSSHQNMVIRRDLCTEAIRLCTILAENDQTATPETCALLALMYLHFARVEARQDSFGGLILLEAQNRKLWNQQLIATGLMWLQHSARGDVFSKYHAEAGIAAEHCLSASFDATRWDRIVKCYELLEQVAPSEIHTLNKAVAIAEWKGPQVALDILHSIKPKNWLYDSYLWSAVLADLYRRCNYQEKAQHYASRALELTPNDAVKQVLKRRLKI